MRYALKMNKPRTTTILADSAALVALAFIFFIAQDPKLGYDDTPIIPGTDWHVHDGMRPQPKVIAAPPIGAPADALVLFDGSNMEEWDKSWKIVDDYMEVNGKGSITT